MKKYIPISLLVLAAVFTLYKANFKNKSSHVTELMLKNIECLATPENPNIRCFGRGSVDCPKDDNQVLYYM